MDSKTIRQKYLDFFKGKKHTIIPSASLIPEHDASALFINAGMHPLVPYLKGEPHPQGKRLASFQKCIRTGDIDEIGDTTHLTFFEMLGNWSLGDYFKEESIKMSYEFLTSKKWLNISPDIIHVSVFTGDEDAPRDEESAKIWQGLGIPAERIYYFGKAENWWGLAQGPCGPDTEIYIDTGKEKCSPSCDASCQCGKYIEVWNNVFLQYNKTEQGKFEPLKQKGVDPGFGLERAAMVLQKKDSVFETDLLWPIIEKLQSLANQKYEEIHETYRIIADHLRAATFIMGDDYGVVPSNLDQGYVVRKLIRRSIRQARTIGIEDDFTAKISETVINEFKDIYPELERNKDRILKETTLEEEKFRKTLDKGLKKFEKMAKKYEAKQEITGKDAFDLYETYGFPLELTKEIANEKDLSVDEKSFNEAFQKHQELSRQGSKDKFKGGLAETSEITKKYHTATHLLHQALRDVLGEDVQQKGSNITAERLRFDFNYAQKMTNEQLKKVEEVVNNKIKEELPVTSDEMTPKKAEKAGAIGLFTDKYDDKVKVYSVGNYSKEICGGPHVSNTKELGNFKITKETSSSAGIRRIKAVLEK